MPLEKRAVSDDEDPDQKFSAFANRDNSDFKWQRARNVVGVLEIYSEPVLKTREELKPRYFKGREKIFDEALAAWEREDLKKDLINALESLPVETCCCGFMYDEDNTKKELVKLLQKHWAKKASKQLKPHGFKVDVFLWNWQNASGKAETNIILIRFFVVASYGFRAASKSGGLGLDSSQNSAGLPEAEKIVGGKLEDIEEKSGDLSPAMRSKVGDTGGKSDDNSVDKSFDKSNSGGDSKDFEIHDA